MVRGILSKRILSFGNIYISDKESSKVKELHKKFGIHVSTNEEVVKRCKLIIIAVKPQDSKKLLKSISDKFDSKQHILLQVNID